MKKIEITKNFYQYQMEPDPNRVLGQNIYVLFHHNECIVFDAGYEHHMNQLLPELKDYNITCFILTHFHPDHCYGLNVLPKQKVIGSKYAVETLTIFDQHENPKLIPDVLIDDDYEIQFHDHTIKLSLNKGHSNCGMLVEVDSKYLLTADEYMSTNDEAPVIPYVAETISQHISALKRIIKEYEGYVFLPAHGVMTKDVSKLKRSLSYLEFAETGDKNINNFYNGEFVFLHEEWHELNIQKKK